MSRGFQARRRRYAPRWIVIAVLLCLLLIGYELYDVIIPFQSQNPLWKEVTVGEPVIDGWMYGGQDEEGYLKFYNQGGVTHVLPPNSHLISLDGQFVIIEDYSPGTLTFAMPMEAISLPWLIGGTVVLAGGLWIVRLRWKASRRSVRRFGSGQFRASRRVSAQIIHGSHRSKRFRSRRSSRFHL